MRKIIQEDTDILENKIPPQSPEIEKSILGSILVIPDLLDNLNRVINPDWFYSTANRKIMTCIMQLYNKQEAIDILTVIEQLERNEWVESVGGMEYVSMLGEMSTSPNIITHINTIEAKYKLRSLIKLGNKIVTSSFNPDAVPEDILEDAEKKMFELNITKSNKEAVHVSEFIAPVFGEIEARKNKKCISGIPTGFRDLDKYTGGWQKGNLIILAARPGMGKTSLALNLLESAKCTAAIFSLEMTGQELTQRLIASGAEVSLFRLRNGHTNNSELNRLSVSAGKINDSSIYINDCSSLNISTLYSQCRKLVKRHNLEFLIVDYLQLMGSVEKNKNTIDRVSEISRGLKLIAKEFNIPVIALSQLNRELEKRPISDRRPKLSDLRDSGSIEQDADLVLFVYRTYEYTKDESQKGDAEIIVAKQRNGGTGKNNLNGVGVA